MNDEQIKHMVDRFLMWRLPENFNPDGGISFEPMFNEHTDHPMKAEPVGTNLFDAQQAEEMVRYMIAEMPAPSTPGDSREQFEKTAAASPVERAAGETREAFRTIRTIAVVGHARLDKDERLAMIAGLCDMQLGDMKSLNQIETELNAAAPERKD